MLFTHLAVKLLQQRSSKGGFTLIELLVSLIISSITIAVALQLAVEILRSDREETALAQTQEEVQAALDFISQDIREASYVYTGAQLDDRAGDLDGVADFFDIDANYQPILAFWKPRVLPYNTAGDSVPTDCSSFPDEQQAECGDIQIERRAYSLVMYLLDTSGKNDSPASIVRYELPKYATDGVSTLTRASGYVDPKTESPNFGNWPYDINGSNLQTSVGGTPAVNEGSSVLMVEYIDDPSSDPGDVPTCEANYARTPAAADSSSSFFACVRTVAPGAPVPNQDIFVVIRGNPDSRFNYEKTGISPLPSFQSRVVLRGVTEKQVQD